MRAAEVDAVVVAGLVFHGGPAQVVARRTRAGDELVDSPIDVPVPPQVPHLVVAPIHAGLVVVGIMVFLAAKQRVAGAIGDVRNVAHAAGVDDALAANAVVPIVVPVVIRPHIDAGQTTQIAGARRNARAGSPERVAGMLAQTGG